MTRHLILQRRAASTFGRWLGRGRNQRQPAQPRRLITTLHAALQSLSRTTDTAILASQGPDWPLPSLIRAGPKVSWLERFGLETAAAAQVRSSTTKGTAAAVPSSVSRRRTRPAPRLASRATHRGTSRCRDLQPLAAQASSSLRSSGVRPTSVRGASTIESARWAPSWRRAVCKRPPRKSSSHQATACTFGCRPSQVSRARCFHHELSGAVARGSSASRTAFQSRPGKGLMSERISWVQLVSHRHSTPGSRCSASSRVHTDRETNTGPITRPATTISGQTGAIGRTGETTPSTSRTTTRRISGARLTPHSGTQTGPVVAAQAGRSDDSGSESSARRPSGSSSRNSATDLAQLLDLGGRQGPGPGVGRCRRSREPLPPPCPTPPLSGARRGPPVVWAGRRSTRPRSSRRRTTWERRGSVALVRCASADIRTTRSGASESIARTKYSQCVSCEARRSCASRTPGSSSTIATSTQKRQDFGSARRGHPRSGLMHG